ncbi:zinc-binding dehydrogenase [Streptomyces sp. NPDC012616]|uniref:NADPH:quinone oxidoreductase family protein n=1 Tax=Streptomyces sp. NPDC012616 TaxID=3364840 RepID=UPI0036E5E431
MKVLQLRDYSGPDGLVLAEVPEPVPASGEVLIAVEAIGVNFPDLLLAQGRYQLRPDLPVVPGCEVAGVVVATPGDGDFRPGDRVAAFTWTGGFAERVAVPARSVAPVSPEHSSAEAAGLLVNHHTALFALERRGNLRPGSEVLVMGAAGGIGTASVQVAKGLGARVVAGVADPGQCGTALAAGADEALVLSPGFAAAARQATVAGRGFDLVVDPVGSWLFEEAIRALAPEGTLVVIGFAAGEIPTIAVNRLLLRNAGLVGAAFGAFLDHDDRLMARQAAELAAMAAAGHVRPQIEGVYDFEELPAQLHRLAQGEICGKAVVRGPAQGSP